MFWCVYVVILTCLKLLLVTAVGLSTYAVTLGFGRHIEDVPVDNIWELVKVTDITSALTLVGAACSKASFALSLLRLTSGWTKVTIWFIIITMTSVLCANAVLPYARCYPSGLHGIHTSTGAVSSTFEFPYTLACLVLHIRPRWIGSLLSYHGQSLCV
jgi:hypothetical protein